VVEDLMLDKRRVVFKCSRVLRERMRKGWGKLKEKSS